MSSDYARQHAAVVAMAASCALITTRIGPRTYDRYWRVTAAGLRYINESEMDE